MKKVNLQKILSKSIFDTLIKIMINPELIKKFTVLPIELQGNTIILAMPNLDDIFAIDEVRLNTQYDVDPRFCSKKQIENWIEENLKELEEYEKVYFEEARQHIVFLVF